MVECNTSYLTASVTHETDSPAWGEAKAIGIHDIQQSTLPTGGMKSSVGLVRESTNPRQKLYVGYDCEMSPNSV